MTDRASAVEYARSVLDVGAASAASKVTYVSSGATALGGWLSTNNLVTVGGLVIAFATFVVNWYYKQRLTEIEIRVKLEAAARDEEEHRARMGMY